MRILSSYYLTLFLAALNRLCSNWNIINKQYDTVIQGLRVVNCNREIVWGKSSKKWSMVLWGMDIRGNVLWCFTRSPFPVDVFARMLLDLNIGVTSLMYLEGGPEASLFLRHPHKSLLLMGSYETGFNENDFNEVFWNIPNVIGIQKKR